MGTEYFLELKEGHCKKEKSKYFSKKVKKELRECVQDNMINRFFISDDLCEEETT